jgi:hypothetical protein
VSDANEAKGMSGLRNSVDRDTSRVEDDVWIRAIMEETLDDVEGREEIFRSRFSSLPSVLPQDGL